MAKKIILALIILILSASLFLMFFVNDNVNVYIDGENVTVSTQSLSHKNTEQLNEEICNLTLNVMNDTKANITTLKNGIKSICIDYGLENMEINIDSSIGKNQIPVMVQVEGTSMLPTLQDGQNVLLNKSHDIEVGDIVVADSDEYGGIIKRVGEINDDRVHLESDNKNVDFEYINGTLYELKGISPWVDLSEINGVVIDY